MDNEEILVVDGQEFRFKLPSREVVRLEELYGKNIFEIFESLSFGTISEIFEAALVSPKDMDKFDMMDKLLTKYTIIELGQDILQKIAVKSGLLRAKDLEESKEGEAEVKNA